MTAKGVIASNLVIALGIILIIHFLLLWVYGGVFVYESNKIILTAETLMSIAITCFGLRQLWSSKSYEQRAPAVLHTEAHQHVSTESIESPGSLRSGTRVATSTITAALVLGLGPFLIFFFTLFWMYGGVFIYEHDRGILAVKILLSIAIILFGFKRLLSIGNYEPEATAPLRALRR